MVASLFAGSILFDKFHVVRHLGDAMDKVRKSEYARLTGKNRRFIKGQKYTLLSHRENLTRDGRRSLKTLLTALAQACSGQIRLTSQTVSNGGGGVNAASGADGPFATWSTGVSP